MTLEYQDKKMAGGDPAMWTVAQLCGLGFSAAPAVNSLFQT